jgi:hypothetical protein
MVGHRDLRLVTFYVEPFMKDMQNLKLPAGRHLHPQALLFMSASLIEVRGGKTRNAVPSRGYWDVHFVLSFYENLMPKD